MTPGEIRLGMRVHYHPVLPGRHDGREYKVRHYQILPCGEHVAWLEGKSGCVAISHLSPALPPVWPSSHQQGERRPAPAGTTPRGRRGPGAS